MDRVCVHCCRRVIQIGGGNYVHVSQDGTYIYEDHEPRAAVVEPLEGPLTFKELDDRAGDFNHLTGPSPWPDETSALELAHMRLDGALGAINGLEEVVRRGGKDSPQAHYFLDQVRRLTKLALANSNGTIDREEAA